MPSPFAEPVTDPQWAAESNLVRILVVTGIFHFLALTSVGLRLYVRIGLLRSPGRDDVVMVLAVLAALGGYICFILQGYHGLGRHTKTVSKEDKVIFDHIGFVQSLLSAIGALGLLKISIALFLLRLRNNNLWKWYARSLWALIVFVVVYTIGAWLSFLLHCTPMEADWTGEGTCYSRDIFVPVALTNTAVNIFTDVCFATLPIPIIWSLQMSRGTRINLIGVLSLGYTAVALGIVKASYQVKTDPDKMFNKHLNVFGFLQLNVGIIAASIPTLKPLTKRRSADTPNRRPYDDIEQHVETIGSGRKYKPQLSFLTKATATDETIEMGKRQSIREKLSMSGQDRKDNVYSQTGDRVGSQDRILESDGEDPKRIKCTTEVVVDSVEKDSKT